MIVCLSLAIKGYKMPLEAKDLWSLNPRDSSKVMVPKLLREWEKEEAKARRYVAVSLWKQTLSNHQNLSYVQMTVLLLPRYDEIPI